MAAFTKPRGKKIIKFETSHLTQIQNWNKQVSKTWENFVALKINIAFSWNSRRNNKGVWPRKHSYFLSLSERDYSFLLQASKCYQSSECSQFNRKQCDLKPKEPPTQPAIPGTYFDTIVKLWHTLLSLWSEVKKLKDFACTM